MSGSISTNETLLDGALQQFTRHGFAKTSMADIAQAAGVSRTALYHHFPNKEDVFKALSRRINGRVYEAVAAAVRTTGTLETRLLGLIHARVGWVYELLHTSAYGRELVNEKNRLCGDEVLAVNDRFESLVGDLLKENLPSRPDTIGLARILMLCVNGILEKATTKEDAEDSVSVLVTVFCGGLR